MDPADYFNEAAPYYDALHATANQNDRQFYLDLAVDADGPVLEVGCGTGRIYLELLDAGVDATGIDVSTGMLDVLRERAENRGLDPDVRIADVRTFESDREYDLVIIPFRSFLHMTTLSDQRAALDRIRHALAPDGIFAMNTLVPDFEYICEQYGQWHEQALDIDGESYMLRNRPEVADTIEQLARNHRELVGPDGETVFEESFDIHLASKREIELLLEQAGFSDWCVYGSFDRDPLKAEDRELIWVVDH